MIIDENMVRSLIKSEKERKVTEYQDEATVLAVMAYTSIQLQRCVDTGDVSEFLRDRVMDMTMLVNKSVIGKSHYLLGEETLLLFRKIMHTLNPDWWIEEEVIADRNGCPYASIDSAEIKRVFSDYDLLYLKTSWFVVSSLIRRQQIIADHMYLQNFLNDEYLEESIYIINKWSEIQKWG